VHHFYLKRGGKRGLTYKVYALPDGEGRKNGKERKKVSYHTGKKDIQTRIYR